MSTDEKSQRYINHEHRYTLRDSGYQLEKHGHVESVKLRKCEICLAADPNEKYVVETGYGKGSYTHSITFDTFSAALFHYKCMNTHSGYKKRLRSVLNNRVIVRALT